MYSKKIYEDGFFGKEFTSYYKNGEYIACRRYGELVLERQHEEDIQLTRAQGFRYWKRYFPDCSCFELPEPLRVAVEGEPKSFGYYIDSCGEIVGYIG